MSQSEQPTSPRVIPLQAVDMDRLPEPRRADAENEVIGIMTNFQNHRITFDDAVRLLTNRIHPEQ